MPLAKQKIENMELLLEVGRLLSSKLKISELLNVIIPLAARVVGADRASLFLVDEEKQELYFDVAMGLPASVAKIRLKMGQGIAGSVAKEQKSIVINNARKDPRWFSKADEKSGYVTRSIIAVPLILRGRCIGVAQGLNKLEGEFTLTDLRLFETFASQAAVAIENARLFSSLSEEKQKLNTLLNEMKDAAILTDAKGGILFTNAAARGFFSKENSPSTLEEAARGMSFTPPLEEILASEKSLVRFDAEREKPKKLALSGTSSMIRSGDSPGRVILFRDVTLEKYEEGLKRSFLSLISHKLKTPLASITGYSQLLSADAKKREIPGLMIKGLETIYEQGTKLAGLVEKLLHYTVLEELDATDVEISDLPVDLVLNDAVSGLRPWLKEHKGGAEVREISNLRIRGSHVLLRDAVKHLIENGVKFGANGGSSVAVWAQKNGDGGVEIHVSDNGPGVPPEESERIFKKFYQIESSFTGQVEGWGLGLPFVLKVVERLNGSVRLDSRPGKGTTVILTLPSAK